MIRRMQKSFFIFIGLVLLLTFTGGIANAQCGTRGKRPCVTKREKAAAKKRIALANTRRKRAVATRRVRLVKAVLPPRDPNRYTMVGNYSGPVTGDGSYSIGPSDPSKPGNPISRGVLNDKARVLPVPAYPPTARAMRVFGLVAVQVLIDEKGDVISAKALSGNPMLRAASVAAARGAKFSPTKLSGRPVKVQGIITYNYVP